MDSNQDYPPLVVTGSCFASLQTMRLLLIAWTIFVPLLFFASIFHYILNAAAYTLTVLLSGCCFLSLAVGILGIIQQYCLPRSKFFFACFLGAFILDASFGAFCFVAQVQNPAFVWPSILFGVHVPLQIYLIIFFVIEFRSLFAQTAETRRLVDQAN